jgi:phage-related protein
MLKIKVTDQLNNVSYEFFDLSDNSILNGFNGFDYPSIKSAVADIPGRIGSALIASSYGRRIFSWNGELVGSDVFGERRKMLSALRQVGEMKLIQFTTYDDLALQCEAEITKVDSPYNHQIQAFLIEAVAPDFRFYSQTLHEDSMAESQIEGGTTIPTPVPIDFDGEAGAGQLEIENAGNEDSPISFVIKGPGTGFTVRNDTTQKQFRINYTIELGDEIVIDTKAKTVLLNGTYNIYSALEGYFWELAPGTNRIFFVADSGADENTLLELEWRDAYNGI